MSELAVIEAVEVHPVIEAGGPDAWIELNALAYDALFPGLGDVLRNTWSWARANYIPCDCPMDPFHRWNCSWTPIYAQTIRQLDINPWTLFR